MLLVGREIWDAITNVLMQATLWLTVTSWRGSDWRRSGPMRLGTKGLGGVHISYTSVISTCQLALRHWKSA